MVINYIEKYLAKAKKGSDNFHDMLMRIYSIQNPNEPTTHGYRSLLCETIVNRDLGAHETCHMVLKLPLCECSHLFVVLNVGMKVSNKCKLTRNTTRMIILLLMCILRYLWIWSTFLWLKLQDPERMRNIVMMRNGCHKIMLQLYKCFLSFSQLLLA